jgi:amino acid transporter
VAVTDKTEAASHELRRELGLPDLMSMQILLVIGITWAGNAALIGPSHVLLWVAGIATLFLPSAAVVNFCARIWPIEGGVYQWTKHAIGPFAGFISAWNFGTYAVLTVASIGILTATSLSYALGPSAAWIGTSTPFILTLDAVLFGLMLAVNITGFGVGRWVAHFGTTITLLVITLMTSLIFFHPHAALHAALHAAPPRQAFSLSMPALTLMTANLFTKLAFNGLTGLEQVAVFAGETRNASRNILRSAWLAAPLIGLIYILMTGAILTYNDPNHVDLNGPVPQLLATAFGGDAPAGGIGWGRILGAVAILAMATATIAQYSVIVAEASRLPMVAAWDHLLPQAFTRLHPRFQTPTVALLTITGLALAFAVLASAGASAAEAFQIIVGSANLSYAIYFVLMFAVPLAAGSRFGLRPDLRPGWWLRVACVSGILVTLATMGFILIPIVPVASAAIFAAKVVMTTLVMNGLGGALYWRGMRASRLMAVQPL